MQIGLGSDAKPLFLCLTPPVSALWGWAIGVVDVSIDLPRAVSLLPPHRQILPLRGHRLSALWCHGPFEAVALDRVIARDVDARGVGLPVAELRRLNHLREVGADLAAPARCRRSRVHEHRV